MEARTGERRRTLLDAATRLFGEKGYHATTVPMIVEAANSSTGSFYMYFRNKEEVFAAALRNLSECLQRVIDEAKSSNTDPVKQFRIALRSVFLYFAEHRREARILIVESSGLSPSLESVRRGLLSQHVAEMRKSLDENPRSFPVRNKDVAARCVVGAVFESVCSWLEASPRKRMPAQELAEEVSEFCLRAVGVHE